jgi:hypothetical protein
MAKKLGKKSGATRRKRRATVKDLLLGTRRGDKTGAVKGGKQRRPSCIPM